MLEPAVIALRLLQYAGAMILFGSSLFALYALPTQGLGSAPETRWFRPLLIWSGVGLLLASLAGLVAQTSVLAGSFGEGLKLSSLGAVVGMGLGRAALIRAVAAALAVAVLVARKADRNALVASAALGGIICASFAWMGHGAATEGPGGTIHLVADILHALAAGAWVGALVAFGGLLGRRGKSVQLDGLLHTALHRFSGVGSGLVAVLVASGLVNSWFLVGPERLSGLWTTPYGQLLSLKLVLFVGMLALAAANRFRHTPALGAALTTGTREPALRALRRSLMLETGLAIAVLGLVAWFGMLAPVSAQ